MGVCGGGRKGRDGWTAEVGGGRAGGGAGQGRLTSGNHCIPGQAAVPATRAARAAGADVTPVVVSRDGGVDMVMGQCGVDTCKQRCGDGTEDSELKEICEVRTASHKSYEQLAQNHVEGFPHSHIAQASRNVDCITAHTSHTNHITNTHLPDLQTRTLPPPVNKQRHHKETIGIVKRSNTFELSSILVDKGSHGRHSNPTVGDVWAHSDSVHANSRELGGVHDKGHLSDTGHVSDNKVKAGRAEVPPWSEKTDLRNQTEPRYSQTESFHSQPELRQRLVEPEDSVPNTSAGAEVPAGSGSAVSVRKREVEGGDRDSANGCLWSRNSSKRKSGKLRKSVSFNIPLPPSPQR